MYLAAFTPVSAPIARRRGSSGRWPASTAAASPTSASVSARRRVLTVVSRDGARGARRVRRGRRGRERSRAAGAEPMRHPFALAHAYIGAASITSRKASTTARSSSSSGISAEASMGPTRCGRSPTGTRVTRTCAPAASRRASRCSSRSGSRPTAVTGGVGRSMVGGWLAEALPGRRDGRPRRCALASRRLAWRTSTRSVATRRRRCCCWATSPRRGTRLTSSPPSSGTSTPRDRRGASGCAPGRPLRARLGLLYRAAQRRVRRAASSSPPPRRVGALGMKTDLAPARRRRWSDSDQKGSTGDHARESWAASTAAPRDFSGIPLGTPLVSDDAGPDSREREA